MPKPISGVHRVKVYEHGSRYQTVAHGFGLKWHFQSLAKWNEIAVQTFDATSANLVGVEPGNITKTPTAEVVDLPKGMGGITSVPYLDASQDIGLDYYETTGGEWEGIDDSEYDGTLIFQRDATENQRVLCRSRFRLPANPLLVFNLWRGEPPEEQDRTEDAPFTAIRFGADGGQYALVMPYGGPAYVAYWSILQSSWVRLEADDNGKLPALGGLGKGERLWVQIGFWRSRICVSIGRGGGTVQWVTYPVPTVDTGSYDAATWDFPYLDSTAKFVQAGPFEIEHTGGQIAFRWWPVKCYTGTTRVAWTRQYDAGYPLYFYTPEEGRLSASSFSWYVQRPLQHHLVDGTIIDRYDAISTVALTVLRPDENPNEDDTTFSWELSWTPVHWTLSNDEWPDSTASGSGSPGYIDYYQAPTVYALFCKTEPVVEDSTDRPTETDISANVQAISVSVPEGSGVAMAGLKLRNTTGAYKALRDGQLVTIELGYAWDDGTNDLSANNYVFTGYVVSPARGAKVGPLENCDVVLYDPMIRLRDEKATYCPDFQLYSPVDAVTWLFKHAGFADAQLSILGSSTPMFAGSADADATGDTSHEIRPESNALVPGFGTELSKSVLEYAKRDNESLVYCAPDWTYLFKAYKTNGRLTASDGTLWTIEEDADWSAKTKYHLYDLSGVERVAIDPEQYAEIVYMRGKDKQGNVIDAHYEDPARWSDPTDADYGGGWRHVVCIERDHVPDQATAQKLAYEKWKELSRRPEVVTFTTDILKTLSRVDRVQLTNSTASGRLENAGIRGNTYRVVRYEHIWNAGELPRTVVVGRSLETT